MSIIKDAKSKKTLGRPHLFNKNEALEKAMNLFWLKGYKDTSISDLLKVMSIKKSSFYNDFESKHGIFLLSIKYYHENLVNALIEILEKTEDPDLNIYNLFKYFVDRMIKYNDMRGCLLGNAINEVAIHDTAICQAIKKVLEKLLIAITNNIQQGKNNKIFKNKNTSAELANFVLLSLQGLLMLGKLEARDNALEINIKMVLEFLRGYDIS